MRALNRAKSSRLGTLSARQPNLADRLRLITSSATKPVSRMPRPWPQNRPRPAWSNALKPSNRAACYGLEQRWPNSPFWARRPAVARHVVRQRSKVNRPWPRCLLRGDTGDPSTR
jgi:hypothetical protein